jgi:hypothetical protein
MELCHLDLQSNPKHDESTGKTPRKRKIDIPDDWALTKEHHELIQEFRTKLTKDHASKLPLSKVTRRFRESTETLDEHMDMS